MAIHADHGYSADAIRATWRLQDSLKPIATDGADALKRARNIRATLQASVRGGDDARIVRAMDAITRELAR